LTDTSTVSQDVVAKQNDVDELIPALDQIEANLGVPPSEVSADRGYCSEANLAELESRGIRAYVATGRQKHGAAAPTSDERALPGPRAKAMRMRLRQGGWRSRYRLRKQTVEPVFGQIKEARGFRRFLMRGLEKVQGEWSMLCTAHNLLKLHLALGAN
jgi:IS5 family transposase